jgi:hypothetical protein
MKKKKRDLAVINCHKTMVELDPCEVGNTFIKKCSTRKNIFALKRIQSNKMY